MEFREIARALTLDEGQLAGDKPAPPVPYDLYDMEPVGDVRGDDFDHSYETLARSYADAVVVRHDLDGDVLLVLLCSQGQAYTRSTYGDTAPRPLTGDSLGTYLSYLGSDGIDAVPWSTPLTAGRGKARRFCELFADPEFRWLATAGRVSCDYGTDPADFMGSDLRRMCADGERALVKRVYKTLAAYAGDGGGASGLVARAAASGSGLLDPWRSRASIYSEQAAGGGVGANAAANIASVFRSLGTVRSLDRAVGSQGAQEFLRTFLETCPDSQWSLDALSIEDALTTFAALGLKVNPKKFTEYACGLVRSEAAGASRPLEAWAETLMLQQQVEKSVGEKYPKDLRATKNRLYKKREDKRRAAAGEVDIREQIRIEREELVARLEAGLPAPDADGGGEPMTFERHAAELRANEDTVDGFAFTVPPSYDDMIEEGDVQHICVGTLYAPIFAAGKTDIYYMRPADDPSRRYIDIEVSHTENPAGKVRQAFRARNQMPSEHELDVIEKWCGRHGIEMSRTFYALAPEHRARRRTAREAAEDDMRGELAAFDSRAAARVREQELRAMRANVPERWRGR